MICTECQSNIDDDSKYMVVYELPMDIEGFYVVVGCTHKPIPVIPGVLGVAGSTDCLAKLLTRLVKPHAHGKEDSDVLV